MTFQQSPKKQPSKKARQSVKKAFDSSMLAKLCTTWDFDKYADKIELGADRFYYYADNDSDVLAVAHLDSVQKDGRCQVVETSAGLLATSGTLDDRLGVYVILDLLPKLGITCDWLLTTDEEIGQSTAEDFETEKAYNWTFQFDRAGTDVVMYDYETPDLVELVEKAGARVGQGSFSDICYLEHLGCAGFNWGVGYEDYHSPRSHAWLEDTFRMVARFAKFYNANKDEWMPYEPKPYSWESKKTDIASLWGSLLVADCGHMVDVEEKDSYIESQGGMLIECTDCGTVDKAEAS